MGTVPDLKAQSPVVRAMQRSDLAAVMEIQQRCHVPDNIEDMTTLTTRLATVPDGSWVASTDRDGVQAYLVTYLSRLGQISALGAGFEPAVQPDCVYLHDLAVAPCAQGQGLAQRLLEQACRHARQHGLAHATLVAVQGSHGFWQRQGFAATSTTTEQAAVLSSYAGGPACYMVKAI